jgi:hypothetical protein
VNREFHVSVSGSDLAPGTKERPFRTISKAAQVAETGDRVVVYGGKYREWVKPEHSGYSDINRSVQKLKKVCLLLIMATGS